MKKVFVSYSTSDSDVASRLVSDIEGSGTECWVAPRDIKPGAAWAGSIMEAITNASVMILLISQESNESVQVIREVEHAVALRIPIIPIKLGDVQLSDSMKYFVSTHQWINAYSSSYEEWYSHLDKRLSEFTGSTTSERIKPVRSREIFSVSGVGEKSTSWFFQKKLFKILQYSVVLLLLILLFRKEFLNPQASESDEPSVQDTSLPITGNELEELAYSEELPLELVPSAIYDAISAYLRNGDISDANRLTDSLTTRFPDHLHTLTALADIAEELALSGRHIESANYFRRAYDFSSRNNDNPYMLIKAAEEYHSGGAYALCDEAIKTILELDTLPEGFQDDFLLWLIQYSNNLVESYQGQSVNSRESYASEETLKLCIGYFCALLVSDRTNTLYARPMSAVIYRLLASFSDFDQREEFQFLLADLCYNQGFFLQAGDLYSSIASRNEGLLRNVSGNAFSSYYEELEQTDCDSSYVLSRIDVMANYYADNFPEGEFAVQFLFADAGSHYNAGEYTIAREAYHRIYEEYPNSPYTARSARFLAAAYEAEEFYSDAELWYERAAKVAMRTGEDLGEDLELLAAAMAYRDAESMMLSGDTVSLINTIVTGELSCALEALVARRTLKGGILVEPLAATNNGGILIVSEDSVSLVAAANRFEIAALNYSETVIAPVALYDAGETYAKAGAIKNSFRVFQELADRYPESPLAPEGLQRAAFLAMESEDFLAAGDAYLYAYNRFPAFGGAYASLYSAAVAYEEGGANGLAMNVYRQIIAEQVATPQTMVIALGKCGDHSFDAHDYQEARVMYQQCVETYDMYREGPASHAAHAARAAFRIGEIIREDYDALAVTPETFEQKAQIKNEIESWYGKSITYNMDVWFMASCVRAGELYEDFANSVAFMDSPASITNPMAFIEYYSQLYSRFYGPQIQRAIDIYTIAIEKAVSANVSNEWVDKAAENLERLAPGTVSTLGLSGYENEQSVYQDSVGMPEDQTDN